jgi:hypothetical protein
MQENDSLTPDPTRDDAHPDGSESRRGAASGGDHSPKEVRVGRLDTMSGIREELSRVYRATRKVVGPRPNPGDATKLGWLLNAIAQTVLSRDLERRIQDLEERQKGGN